MIICHPAKTLKGESLLTLNGQLKTMKCIWKLSKLSLWCNFLVKLLYSGIICHYLSVQFIQFWPSLCSIEWQREGQNWTSYPYVHSKLSLKIKPDMFAGGGGGGRGCEVKLDFLITGVTRHFLPLRPFILLTIKNRGRASGLSSSSETVIEFRSKRM